MLKKFKIKKALSYYYKCTTPNEFCIYLIGAESVSRVGEKWRNSHLPSSSLHDLKLLDAGSKRVVVVVFVGKTTLLLRAPSLLLLFRPASAQLQLLSLPSFLPWTLFYATRLPGQCFSLAVEDDDDDDDGSQGSSREIQYCLSFSRLSFLRDLVVTGGLEGR